MFTPSRPVRWGILGPGFIAQTFASDLARTPGVELVAVASRDLDRAESFAAEHGAARAFGSYAELGDCVDVDVVYVATPHSHHYEHGKLMIERGKSLLVEKPFTMTATQAEHLAELAKARGIFLMEGVWTLCNPLFRDLLTRVHRGDIGAPHAFTATVGPIGVPRGHRVGDPTLGGSFLLECLMYPLSIARALAPQLFDTDEVQATAVRNDLGVDIAAALTLKSAAGFATMGGGFVTGAAGAGTSTFQLSGSRGWLQVDDSLFNPGRAVLSIDETVEVVESDLHEQGYRWEIEEVNRCIRGGALESDVVPVRATLEVMRTLDRARASAGIGVAS